MTKLVKITLLFSFPMWLNAQLDTDADFRRQVYDYEFSGGVMFHTRGFGANFRYLKYTDGYTKIGAELDFVSIRHPKEIKFPGQQTITNSNNRSFVFGKLNAFSSLRLGLGTEKILFDKTDQGSISINWLLFGGASLGFLRPIYLEINRKTPSGNDVRSVERYNPETHNFLNILGQAPIFTGMSETKLRMGLYAKTGFSFDYNWNDDSVSTIEIGAIVDYFPQWFGLYPEGGVPIMHEAKNYEVWVQFYCTFNFGKKWN